VQSMGFNQVGGEIRCHLAADGGHQVIRVSGDVDLSTVEVMRRSLQSLTTAAGERIVLDLREVDFIDSVGISSVVEQDARAAAAGARLELVTNPRVDRVLRLTGLDRRLAVSAAAGA
jgi:anti-sigma B factor antagonist